MHALLAGRTATGERVWDVMRLIDWAQDIPEIDTSTILVMGNSGGGVITCYAAAVDPRITIAVPSCSFCTLVGTSGLIHHCDCNGVPGILRFGEIWGYYRSYCPAPSLYCEWETRYAIPVSEVDRAVKGIARLYEIAGCARSRRTPLRRCGPPLL